MPDRVKVKKQSQTTKRTQGKKPSQGKQPARSKKPIQIKKQTRLPSENVTPERAAEEMSKAQKWAPHLSDGLDALEHAFSKKELKKWSRLVAEAWADDKFKEHLIRDPLSALKRFGIDMPAGLEFRVVENTEKLRYIVLPPRPVADVTQLGEREFLAAAFTSSTTFFCRPPKWADTWIIITA